MILNTKPLLSGVVFLYSSLKFIFYKMQKILLLHGALGSQDHFTAVKEKLSTVFVVYTFNFKGHGGTAMPDDFSIANFAAEIGLFLDQNKVEKINIFGYSMGGYVGLYFAKNSPERVEKLFTLATKWNWTTASAAQETKLLNPTIIKEKVPKFAANLEQLHGDSWEILMHKTAVMMLQLGAQPTFQDTIFQEIATPILLAVGDKDAMVSIEETTHVYRLLPNAQLLIVPDMAHPIERVNVDELAHQIRKFFG